ncbi:MAG TPA: hypothetical protein VJ725_11685 [Thermoanaerobaculia bacterium]|nr:hypothetical protein [Thermoanaerobaculia bacterium]
MRKFRAALGLLAGIVMVLSSAAHSLLGWKQFQAALEELQAPSDLIFGLAVGWHFGGVAIFTFGCIAIVVFASVLRGRAVSLLPTALIAIAYMVFGIGALAMSKNPFFFIFIVPGLMLAFASLPARAAA